VKSNGKATVIGEQGLGKKFGGRNILRKEKVSRTNKK